MTILIQPYKSTTMRKKYIIPTIDVTFIDVESVVAVSLPVDEESTTNTQYIKEDNTSRQGYNVWNDDWRE